MGVHTLSIDEKELHYVLRMVESDRTMFDESVRHSLMSKLQRNFTAPGGFEQFPWFNDRRYLDAPLRRFFEYDAAFEGKYLDRLLEPHMMTEHDTKKIIIFKALRKVNIEQYEELMSATPRTLKFIRNFGVKSQESILNALHQLHN